MSRLTIPPIDELPSDSKPVIEGVQKRLGFVPNMHRLLAISPAVIQGVMALQSALNRTLDAKIRNGIALAVSAVNGCNYCQSAHSFYASTLGKLSDEEIELNRHGRSSDHKRAAAIHFAKQVTETRGKVSEADVQAVRDAGFSDAHILEIVALSVQFLMTNFINNVAETQGDDYPDSNSQDSVVVIDAD
jgi:uncharacterized peroxidase-related enzyme